MIRIVEGDILNAPENIIGHQVNCQGVMGAGLAKQIRNKYPEVYTNYKEFVANAKGSMGKMQKGQWAKCKLLHVEKTSGWLTYLVNFTMVEIKLSTLIIKPLK